MSIVFFVLKSVQGGPGQVNKCSHPLVHIALCDFLTLITLVLMRTCGKRNILHWSCLTQYVNTFDSSYCFSFLLVLHNYALPRWASLRGTTSMYTLIISFLVLRIQALRSSDLMQPRIIILFTISIFVISFTSLSLSVYIIVDEEGLVNIFFNFLLY